MKLVKIFTTVGTASSKTRFFSILIAGCISSGIILLLYLNICNELNKNPVNSEQNPTHRLIFYNRTGSTTFTNAIAYDLYAQNGFHIAHLNLTKNRFQMDKLNQAKFVRNITGWSQMHPLFLHGHISFINFQSFGFPNPVWINILREPFERFVSHYYFLRYGDNYRVGLKRSKAGNNETFDECFLRGAKECEPTAIWLQIPYICGTAHFCFEPGNQRALEQAKRNLIDHYLLVGVTERMEQMIVLLEELLPQFFNGASQHFRTLDAKRTNLRHTLKKIRPSEKIEQQFKGHPIYKMEKEFYDFALAEFDSVWRRSMNGGIQFRYEKIRP